jgi:hypothetical protein
MSRKTGILVETTTDLTRPRGDNVPGPPALGPSRWEGPA